MVDYQRCFHQGVRVPDLDQAMIELGSMLGVTWCVPQQVDQRLWLPDEGVTTLPLRFTYSAEGPHGLLVELVSTAIRPMFERWFAGGPLG